MRICKFALIVIGAVALTSVLSTAIAMAAGRRLVKNPTPDAKAPVVDLFEGIEQKSLKARLIPKSSLGGSVFIENKSNQPITVKLPKAVVAVQVLKQGH